MSSAATSMDPARIVTLCFHGIGKPHRELEPGESRFWVTREQFHEIVDSIQHSQQRVELTFDDGNDSDFSVALPLLTSRGYAAEFFIIAGRLGARGSVSAEELAEIRRAGMEVGTHGMRHVPWTGLQSDVECEEEFESATRVLENIVQAPIRHASCPRGAYNRAVLQELKRHGFERIYLVDGGPSRASEWLRDRYSVTEHDDGETISRLISCEESPAKRLSRATKRTIKRWR